MKFKLTITLGNDAMQSCHDVRRALIAVTNRLQQEYDGKPRRGDSGSILDANGHTVGSWEFKGKR